MEKKQEDLIAPILEKARTAITKITEFLEQQEIVKL